MTLCTPSPLTRPVPSCTQYLEIGTITSLSSNINVYIQDMTTGRVDLIEATSDGTGLITLALETLGTQSSHTYEIWVTLQGADAEDKEDLTVETTTAEKFALRFRDIFDGEDAAVFTTQTLMLV